MASLDESSVIRKPPNHLRTLHERDQEKRLIVILDQASLETVKIGKQYELLNCDKHKGIIKKFKKERDVSTCRPDITHQTLLNLMDSPLNRAGLLQVYVHTEKKVLIEINPQTRLPRTFDRFCPLMVQLLHKFSIHAADGNQKLLKVIKNPVTDHLPTGCTKIALSYYGERVKLKDLIPDDRPIVFVLGAMAHGSVNVDYTERSVSISSFPLSAAVTAVKLASACEKKWGVDPETN